MSTITYQKNVSVIKAKMTKETQIKEGKTVWQLNAMCDTGIGY